MKLRLVFQAILIFSILTIIGIFYYKFFQNQENIAFIDEKNELKEDILENEISSQLVNIEYNSIDSNGNTFYINAKKATVIAQDQMENKVNLDGVVSIINLKNKGFINVYSKKAIYDKVTNDTKFFNDVRIEYLDNIILSENLDILFSEKKSKIYNNVNVKNANLNLTTDNILIDMLTGDLKLKMNNNSEKIKLITKNELIN